MAEINPQAVELNEIIQQTNPHVNNLLSDRGKRIFFPAKGILGQAGEAKGKRINATIGTALEDDGSPLRLKCLEDMVDVEPQAFLYAPSFGRPDLRQLWREMILAKNPSLAGKNISTPVVTQALTHALSMVGYLFLNRGEALITTDMFWGNYRLLFENAWGARISTFNTFTADGFDVDAMEAVLMSGRPGKRVLLLNFPNNPTGYTVTEAEAERLVQVLAAAADAGNELVVVVDDAYFGLVYEDGILRESIFAQLADAHERILAVKVDGATKEDYVWGFRVGFLTYGVKGGTEEMYQALEAKTAGAIRGNVSNIPNLSQCLLLKAFTHADYKAQKQEKYNTLKARYDRVREIFAAHPEYAEEFEALPCNSGYFMCVRLADSDPEEVRQILLNEFDTGLIAASGVLRVAFSSTPLSLLDDLFANIYAAAQKADR